MRGRIHPVITRGSSDRPTAPALARGLDLIARLEAMPGASLDALARATAVPKSSLLRLLQVLEARGLAERVATGWRGRVRLAPAPAHDLSEQVAAAMPHLAAAAGCTAEWWVPSPSGMILAVRCEAPAGEVAVRARTGFLRPWDDELDAVCLLGRGALGGSDLPSAGCWTYARGGRRRPVPPGMVQRLARAAARQGSPTDAEPNGNGVRRSARLLGTVGILALAWAATPAAADPSAILRSWPFAC